MSGALLLAGKQSNQAIRAIEQSSDQAPRWSCALLLAGALLLAAAVARPPSRDQGNRAIKQSGQSSNQAIRAIEQSSLQRRLPAHPHAALPCFALSLLSLLVCLSTASLAALFTVSCIRPTGSYACTLRRDCLIA
eukprot:825993-Prymnesium_polylepis.1